jgi:hypothetical protein
MSGEVDSQVADLYDSEIIQISEVINRLNQTVVWSGRRLESAEREIKERFQHINLNVTVTWVMDAGGYSIPQITIVSRVDAIAFDHDRMRHEVQSGMLNGDPGAIHRDGHIIAPSKSVAGFDKKV